MVTIRKASGNFLRCRIAKICKISRLALEQKDVDYIIILKNVILVQNVKNLQVQLVGDVANILEVIIRFNIITNLGKK